MKKLIVAIALGLVLTFTGLAYANVSMPLLEVSGTLRVGLYGEAPNFLVLKSETSGVVGLGFTVTVTYVTVDYAELTASATINGDVNSFGFSSGYIQIAKAPLTLVWRTTGTTQYADALALRTVGYATTGMELIYAPAAITINAAVDTTGAATSYRAKAALKMMPGLTIDALADYEAAASLFGYGVDAVYSMGMFSLTGAFVSTPAYGVKAVVTAAPLTVTGLYTDVAGATTMQGRVAAALATASVYGQYTIYGPAPVNVLEVGAGLTPMPGTAINAIYWTSSAGLANYYARVDGTFAAAPWTFKAAARMNGTGLDPVGSAFFVGVENALATNTVFGVNYTANDSDTSVDGTPEVCGWALNGPFAANYSRLHTFLKVIF